jgi:hypothetical protein
LNRREFLQIMLAGAMGTVFVPTLPAGNGEQKPEVWQVSQGKLPPPRAARAYPTQTPRTYRGANLEYVLMPIGGIGTGTVWLDGQGKLSVWQIFNNDTEEPLPHVHFALRLDGELYLLQTPCGRGRAHASLSSRLREAILSLVCTTTRAASQWM